MRIWTIGIVLVLASVTSFAKEVVCSGTGAASSISTVPFNLPDRTFLNILKIDSEFSVAYTPSTDNAKESLTIAKHNSDGSTIFASGSTSGIVEMTIADAKSKFKITCVVVHDFYDPQ